MHWYNGGIVEAITASKQKGAIFVVYIEGTDEKSVQITNLINTQEITNKLENDQFVAIKIEANSVPHQQFSEIYKQASVPSLYFIGKNGVPLEIITEASDEQNLASKIDGILQKGSVSVASSAAAQSENFISNEQSSVPVSVPADVVCENGVCTIRKNEPAASTTEPAPSQDAAATASASEDTSVLTDIDKVRRAKELVEKQRELKQKEEEENERQKEIERRKTGQNVQQMKRWQEDQELKQLKEEREREKREHQAARDRVLAQIAQDKAERASKFSSPTPAKTTSPPAQPSICRPVSNVAKLQFKLPDGSSHTHDFASADSLDTVVAYIKANLKLTYDFALSTSFPRREFTVNDYSQSLLDLQLVPNAVLLVLPTSHGSVATNQGGGGIVSIFWVWVSPILGILNFVKNFLFGSSGSTDNEQKGPSTSSSDSSSRGGSNTVMHIRSKYDLNNKLKSAGRKLVVIDFFATWCGPCKMIAPRLEELARQYSYVVFLKVDVDENRDISREYGVSAMPTFVFVKNGRTVTTFSGADYYQIKDTIDRNK